MTVPVISSTPHTVAIATADAPKQAGKVATFCTKNLALVISGTVLVVIVLAVLLLPFVLPSATDTDPVNRLLPPGTAGHLLGTDSYGRDVLARLAMGGRASLGMGVLVTAISIVIGGFLGLVSGYFRRSGEIIMRIADAWMAFPAIVLAMIFAVVFGPGVFTVLLAIGIIIIPFAARVLRSRTLEVTSRTFVEAARVSGMGPWKTLFVHVFPNVAPLLIVQSIIYIALTMLIDGGLSFLGLGIAQPAPTWGNMIAESRTYLTTAPHLILFPGLALALTVFFMNMFGTSLRPVFDPQTRALNELNRLRTRGK